MADEQIGQDEIEELLRQAQHAAGGVPKAPAQTATPAPPPVSDAALDQSEIEALLGGSSLATATATPVAASKPAVRETPAGVDRNDVELLLSHAQDALASIDREPELPVGVQRFEFADLGGTPASSEVATLELVRDVQLDLNIELGRTRMNLEDVLRVRRGSVVPLDKLAGDPVDVFVNGRMIARGEVLVLNDNFCVRITELVVGDSACA